jgi:hypothetical protein
VDKKYGSLLGGRVSPWKNIRRGCSFFSSFAIVEVVDGSRTKFWHDVWCRDRPLKESFLELF